MASRSLSCSYRVHGFRTPAHYFCRYPQIYGGLAMIKAEVLRGRAQKKRPPKATSLVAKAGLKPSAFHAQMQHPQMGQRGKAILAFDAVEHRNCIGLAAGDNVGFSQTQSGELRALYTLGQTFFL